MKYVRAWKQKDGVEIVEVDFAGGTHSYEVWVDNVFITSILVWTPEQSDEMRDALDNGEDVRDWEDGHGNSIGTLIEKTRMMNHEEEEEE